MGATRSGSHGARPPFRDVSVQGIFATVAVGLLLVLSLCVPDARAAGIANTTPPSITGSPVAGQTLTCDPGTWSPPLFTYSYQWQDDAVDISGATDPTYTTGPANVGHRVTCVVGGTSGHLGAQPASSAPVTVIAPQADVLGPAVVGDTVDCDTSSLPDVTSVQWLEDGAPTGPQGATWQLTPPLAGHEIACRVSYDASPPVTSAAVTVASASTSLPGGPTSPPPTALPSTPVVPAQGQAALLAVRGSVPAGQSLLFVASGGTAGSVYYFKFPDGSSAVCDGARPVLGAVFTGPTAGSVALTVYDSGSPSATTSTPFAVTAVHTAVSAAVPAAHLLSSSCSATQSGAPVTAQASLPPANRCSLMPTPPDVYEGFVDMRGPLSLVDLSALSSDDRSSIPFQAPVVHKLHGGSVPANDAKDRFYASFCPIYVNGLKVSPHPGHAIILAQGGGSTLAGGAHSLLKNPNGIYIASGGATVDVVAKGTTASIQIADGPLSWDASESTAGTAQVGDVKLSNLAAGIPGIGWLAGQVVAEIPGVDRTVTSIGFKVRCDAGAPASACQCPPRGGCQPGQPPANAHYVTEIPFQMNLPSGFGDGTAAVTLESDNDSLLQVGDFRVTFANLLFGPVQFNYASLEYSRLPQVVTCSGETITVPKDSLSGCALTPIFNGLVTGVMVIDNVGDRPSLSQFLIDYIGDIQVIPSGDEITLTRLSGHLNVDQKTLSVNGNVAVLGAAQFAPGCGVLGLDGAATITFDPFLFTAGAQVNVLCVGLPAAPGAFGYIDGDGNVSAGTYEDIDLGDVGYIKGNLSGGAYLNTRTLAFHARLDENATIHLGFLHAIGIDGDVHGAAVISDTGAAACVHVHVNSFLGPTDFDAGIGVRYNLSDVFTAPGGPFKYLADNFSFLGSDCNVDAYSSIRTVAPQGAAARVADETPYQIKVPGHPGTVIVVLHGSGGAPGAILRGPGGDTLDASAAGVVKLHKAIVLQLPAAQQTEIQITDPKPGIWAIEQAPGTPPITAVDMTRALGAPAVTGHVTGRGSARTLRYTSRNLPAGTTINFVEAGRGGGGLLGVARRSRGVLRFAPSNAGTGPRTIVAQVTAPDGSARPTLFVTRYTAARPGPGRAAGVRIRRSGLTLRVSFRPASGAKEQLATVRLSDGRRQTYQLGRRAHGFTITAIPRNVHVTAITVRGRSAAGLLGPVLKARGG